MNRDFRLTILLTIGLYTGIFCQDVNPFEIKTTIQSSVLSEERAIDIILPLSYFNQKNQNYPVAILLDGDSHLDATKTLMRYTSAGTKAELPEMILIAIPNVDRERDFTFEKIITKRPNTMGGGKNFLKFLETELIPWINKDYRTDKMLLIGHSLGGLFALRILLENDSVFDWFICIDPSIPWNTEEIKKNVPDDFQIPESKHFYLASANHDDRKDKWENRHNVLFQEIIKDNLESNMLLQYFPNKDHRSIVTPAIYDGLKWISQH